MTTDNTQRNVDYAAMDEIQQPYPDGGTLQLRQGQYSGKWYQGRYADQAGVEYTAIWTEVDWSADAEDACDWGATDYLVEES